MNEVKGAGSVVVGSNNECSHDNCILIGDGLKSDYDYQLKIGSRHQRITKRMDEIEFITIKLLINSIYNR